ADVPDARGRDESLRADKVVDRTVRCILRRMGDGAEADAGAFGEFLERRELRTYVSSAMTIEGLAAAHVRGDRSDGDHPHIAALPDHAFERVEVFGEQEHLLTAAASDLLQSLDPLKLGAGGFEPWAQRVGDIVFGGEHDGAAGLDPRNAVRPGPSGGRARD